MFEYWFQFAPYLEVLEQTGHGVRVVSRAGNRGLPLKALHVLIALEKVLLLLLICRKHLIVVQERLEMTQLMVIQSSVYR